MVNQEQFLVERWMDEYETLVQTNIAETCCSSLSLDQVSKIIGSPIPTDKIVTSRLTYGSIPGSAEARDAIAGIYNSTKGSVTTAKDLTKDNLVITNGAIGANFLLYYTLLGKGDHAVIVNPIYQQLESVPRVFGADVDEFWLTPENDYQPDLDLLRKLVKSNTKLLVINSPHNPTGTVWSTETLKSIVETVKEKTDSKAFIHCDEVYRPLYVNASSEDPHLDLESSSLPCSIVHLYEKGISTSSATKAYGLAGLRFGWIASQDTEFLADCLSHRDYNTISVSMIDDIIAAWVFRNGGWLKLVNHNLRTVVYPNLKILDDFVSSSNGSVSYTKPQGGTVTLLRITNVSDTVEFCRNFIKEKSVLVVPGETFKCPGAIRVGFANDTNDLIKGLEKLKEYLVSIKNVESPWNL